MVRYGKKLEYEDQDILNVAFYHSKVILPLKYNLSTGYTTVWAKLHETVDKFELEEAYNDPVIVHFSAHRPWMKYFNDRDPHPYSSSFYKYQRQTVWKDVPVVDRRPFSLRLRHFMGNLLRAMKLKAPLPAIYKQLPPID